MYLAVTALKLGVCTHPLISPIRCCRNHHSLTFQTLTAKTDIYKDSFFPQTITDGNALSDLIISSPEGTEDGVGKMNYGPKTSRPRTTWSIRKNSAQDNLAQVVPISKNNGPNGQNFRRPLSP